MNIDSETVLKQDARFLHVTKWAFGLIHDRIIIQLKPCLQVAQRGAGRRPDEQGASGSS